MVFAGRWAGKQNLFVAYERSYPLISPEGYFYRRWTISQN
jgi:hypothetical protein